MQSTAAATWRIHSNRIFNACIILFLIKIKDKFVNIKPTVCIDYFHRCTKAFTVFIFSNEWSDKWKRGIERDVIKWCSNLGYILPITFMFCVKRNGENRRTTPCLVNILFLLCSLMHI